jgi:hypothetical protein
VPKEFYNKFVYLYEYDSYDITPFVNSKGKWELDPKTGLPSYQLVYSLDWTGGVMEGDQRNDAPNQLKFARTAPLDKTVLTSCNTHFVNAGSDRCPVIFATGTAKSINYKHMAESGYDIANAPYSQ